LGSYVAKTQSTWKAIQDAYSVGQSCACSSFVSAKLAAETLTKRNKQRRINHFDHWAGRRWARLAVLHEFVATGVMDVPTLLGQSGIILLSAQPGPPV
jgi:hypothetical protein